MYHPTPSSKFNISHCALWMSLRSSLQVLSYDSHQRSGHKHAKTPGRCNLVGRLVRKILMSCLAVRTSYTNIFMVHHGYMDKIFSTCLNDSDDMTKFESRSKSSGWRDAFCAPARLTTCK